MVMYLRSALVLLGAAALAQIYTVAEAGPTEKQRYTHPACEDDHSQCGAIIYGVDGAYVVNPVKLTGLSSMPSGVSANPACSADWEATFSNGLDIGQYDTFVVPGPCEYHLKIQIQLGNKKDRKLYLIPGCEIQEKTDGTTLSNDWHSKVVWTDDAKKAADAKGQTLPDPPQDAKGNKCGRV
jgi:hypothetical protein